MIRAVVYDVDGTLLDTIDTIAGYANAALEKFGLPTQPTEKYKYFVGNGAKKLVERMIDASGVPQSEYYDKVYEYYNKLYDSSPIGVTKPFDGIPELISDVNKLGIRQAVLSNKPDYATCQVVTHFFPSEFYKVYGGREGIKLKPDPDALLSILRELQVSPSECLYVGDTYVDMLTGKSAGAFTVGVLWGFRDRAELEEYHADRIVKKPSEIFAIINELNEA